MRLNNSRYADRRRLPKRNATFGRYLISVDQGLKSRVEENLDRSKGQTFSGLVAQLLRIWVEEEESL